MPSINVKAYIVVSMLILLGSNVALAEPETCTYTTYKWNVNTRTAVAFQRVRHAYHELDVSERDLLTGCTVCEEDQVVLDLPGLQPFRMCYRIADQVQATLLQLVDQGEPIHRIIAYRVGMTRGEVDAQGNRTRFSNHSFGIALDINDQLNGLYDHCIKFGSSCRLIKGGPWSPGQPGSWTADSVVVKQLEAVGLKWGGLIKGKQKDFMHFSPTGY